MDILTLNPDRAIIFPTEPTEISTNVTVTLKLTNKTSDWVAYKMKTTAPNFYLVRLSNGVIPPNSHAEVQIIQKPMQQSAEYTQHRFLVQGVRSPSSDQKQDAKAVWEQVDKASIQEKRLGVFFTSTGSTTGGKEKSTEEQYRELVRYVEGLEVKKKNLAAQALTASPSKGGAGGGGSSSGTSGGLEFSLQQLIVAVVVALVAAKILDFMS